MGGASAGAGAVMNPLYASYLPGYFHRDSSYGIFFQLTHESHLPQMAVNSNCAGWELL